VLRVVPHGCARKSRISTGALRPERSKSERRCGWSHLAEGWSHLADDWSLPANEKNRALCSRREIDSLRFVLRSLSLAARRFGVGCHSLPGRRVCLLCASKGAQVAKPRSTRSQSEPNARPGDTFSATRSRGDRVVTRHERTIYDFAVGCAGFTRVCRSRMRRIRAICLG
jgi:hypothetical protein